jgi:hypothetical protein
MFMKLILMFCSAVLSVCGIGLAQPTTTATTSSDFFLMYGTVESYKGPSATYDGPAILTVRSEEDSTVWEVTTAGGFRTCPNYQGRLSDVTRRKVTVRGEIISSKRLDVCKEGTYIKIHDYSEPKVDSIITFDGSVEYYDPTPTYVDGLGILIVKVSSDKLWEISFGGHRPAGCTAPFPYQQLGKDKTVSVAGKVLKNGTLDVCAEGTYVRLFGTSVADRYTSQPFAIEKSVPVQKGRTQGRYCTVDGRVVTTGNRDISNMNTNVPSKSLLSEKRRISKQIIVHP